MPSTIEKLEKKGLIRPPTFLAKNVQYETITGSVAYGMSTDSSDFDIYGFCIPPKDMVFPHLAGQIDGFGKQIQKYEQYQQHHVDCKEEGRQYDLTIFSIVKYFQLCMENNPNCIDTLFTPQNCVLHTTQVGNMVRENRRLFLHKGCWYKFKGYAFSQLHKMKGKNPEEGSKRAELREKFGFDVKFASHVVRLMLECEMILAEGDLDLQRHKEQLKAVRRGEVPVEEIEKWFNDKEKQLEKLYHDSKLRYSPDESAIKTLLLNCLEHHYGSLSECVVDVDAATKAFREMEEVVKKYQNII